MNITRLSFLFVLIILTTLFLRSNAYSDESTSNNKNISWKLELTQLKNYSYGSIVAVNNEYYVAALVTFERNIEYPGYHLVTGDLLLIGLDKYGKVIWQRQLEKDAFYTNPRLVNYEHNIVLMVYKSVSKQESDENVVWNYQDGYSFFVTLDENGNILCSKVYSDNEINGYHSITDDMIYLNPYQMKFMKSICDKDDIFYRSMNADIDYLYYYSFDQENTLICNEHGSSSNIFRLNNDGKIQWSVDFRGDNDEYVIVDKIMEAKNNNIYVAVISDSYSDIKLDDYLETYSLNLVEIDEDGKISFVSDDVLHPFDPHDRTPYKIIEIDDTRGDTIIMTRLTNECLEQLNFDMSGKLLNIDQLYCPINGIDLSADVIKGINGGYVILNDGGINVGEGDETYFLSNVNITKLTDGQRLIENKLLQNKYGRVSQSYLDNYNRSKQAKDALKSALRSNNDARDTDISSKPPPPGGLALRCCNKRESSNGVSKTCKSDQYSYTCNCASGACW